jgi:hypothetical protein
MRGTLRSSTGIAAVALLLFVGVAAAQRQPAAHMDKLAAGKNGDVTFTTETRLADITLKPGRYFIQHRLDGTAHYVHLTEVTSKLPLKRRASDAIGEETIAHPGEVECELEPLNKKAGKTSVFTTKENGMSRIVRIEIAGEDVAHIF